MSVGGDKRKTLGRVEVSVGASDEEREEAALDALRRAPAQVAHIAPQNLDAEEAVLGPAPPPTHPPAELCRSFRDYAAQVHELFEARRAAGELGPFLDLLLALPLDDAIEHVDGLVEARRSARGGCREH